MTTSSSPEELSPRALGRATLARQGLLERRPAADRGDVGALVDALGGLQAQEPQPPFVALWSRVEGFAREDLHGALRAGELVRATLHRATLHVVSAGEHGREQRPQPRELAAGLKHLGARAEGLEPDAVLPVARELLAERPRTFGELRGALAERFPGVHERALGFCVRMLLPVRMVATDDRWGFPRDAAFALADLDEGAAAAPEDLVRRHLAAFGPASVADVQAWSGLGGLKAVVEGMDDLVRLRSGRRTLFDLPDAPRPGEDAEAPPRLLAPFDALVLAHKDRTRVVPEEHRARLVTKNLRVPATFLVDGLVAGTWRLESGRVALDPFAPLPPAARRTLDEESERLAAFLGE